MKYRFALPANVDEDAAGGVVSRDVTFECETPGEQDLGDGGEAVRAFVDRAIETARYVVARLEKKS